MLVKRIHGLFPDQETLETDYEVLEKIRFLLIPDYTPAKEIPLGEDVFAQRQEHRIIRLRKRIKALKQANSELTEDLDTKSLEIEEKNAHMKMLEQGIAESNEQIAALEKGMKQIGARVAEIQAARASEVDAMQEHLLSELDTLRKQKDTEIEELKNNFAEREGALAREQREQKKAMKKRERELLAQLQTERDHLEQTKLHCDRMLNGLRGKLEKAQEKEAGAVSKFHQVQGELQELQAESTRLAVENRMATLKLKAAEERSARAESATEARHKLALMKAESEAENKHEAVKSECELRISKLLVGICERFNEFCDFSRPISEGIVHETLDRDLRFYKQELGVLDELKHQFEADESADLRYKLDKKLRASVQKAPPPVEVRHVQVDATRVIPTQRLLITIAAAVHRMQKLSGHLSGTIWGEGGARPVMDRSFPLLLVVE
jgi:chromosome segregation ATPase